MKSNLGKFLKSRTFFIQLAILLFITVGGFFGVSGWLNSYTHHGENIAVPDLRGKKITALDPILAPHKFHFKVVDSLFDIEKIPGAVIDQDPSPGSKVKENRTIYLTINSTQPPDVKMPDLVDVSHRQAEAILQSYGLVIGEISYRTDLAKNAVLEQHYKNRIIKPGTLLPKGSVIDLVLGDGFGDIAMEVPDLSGMTLSEAKDALRRASLELGEVNYDDDDSPKATVYLQKPSPFASSKVKQGDAVDIYLH